MADAVFMLAIFGPLLGYYAWVEWLDYKRDKENIDD